jgi:hypothetical protein
MPATFLREAWGVSGCGEGRYVERHLLDFGRGACAGAGSVGIVLFVGDASTNSVVETEPTHVYQY